MSDARETAGWLKRVAIVGADETDEIGIVPNMTPIMMHAQAARNALRDAGIDKRRRGRHLHRGVGGMASPQLAEYLGIVPRVHRQHDGADRPSSSTSSMRQQRSPPALHRRADHPRRDRTLRPDPARPRGGGPVSTPRSRRPVRGAVRCRRPAEHVRDGGMRHMHEYGTTSEQLAEIAVATRKWAQLNPRAIMRDPLTIDDVLSSRWVAYPFHIFDCCLVTDAGGAVVVVSADRARDFKKKPVWVLGSGEASTHQSLLNMPDLTRRRRRYSGKPRARHGGRYARGHRCRRGLRLLHLHRPRHARGAGLLRAGRGRPVRLRPAHRPRRRLPDEHERRRPLVHAPGHVRDVHPDRGCAAAPRGMRPAPGARREARTGQRHRRHAQPPAR